MENMKLYEIDQALENCFDPETGEILDEQAFTDLQEARDKKLEGVGCIIKNRQALIDSMKAEEQRLKERVATLERQNESTLKFLDHVLDGRAFETAQVKCAYRKSKAVEIVNENVIPPEWMVTKTTVTPDKANIKKALIQGVEIPGCNLLEKNNLSIK